MFEGDGLGCAAVVGDGDAMGAGEFGNAANDVHFAPFGHAGKAAGEFFDDAFFVLAQVVHADFRRVKLDAGVGDAVRFFDDFADVQQGFGRDAADVQADTTEGLVALDQGDFQAEVGGAEGGGVTGRACADDEHVHRAFRGRAAGDGGGGSGRLCGRCRLGSCRRSGFCGCGGGGCCRCGAGTTGAVEGADGVSGGDFVADFDGQGGDNAVCRCGDVHRGFVGFEGDERVFFFDAVARLDQDFDDVNVGEVAQIGNDDRLGCHVFTSQIWLRYKLSMAYCITDQALFAPGSARRPALPCSRSPQR